MDLSPALQEKGEGGATTDGAAACAGGAGSYPNSCVVWLGGGEAHGNRERGGGSFDLFLF